VDDRATTLTKSRYNRIAPVYDLMEGIIERFAFRRWRERLWSQVDGNRVLEVGVGTGKNLPYYPRGVQVTAVDLSDKMLERARRRAQELGNEVDLRLMDTQRLAFPDAAFDVAVATFVFCSVPDPVRGLRELGRVVRPGGWVLLLEHVRVNKPVIGRLMDLLDPLVVRLMGPHINRRTVENVRKAGLEIERVEELAPGGLVKLIVARTEQGQV
jgi:phosphatidylethanolamine/phosphatidyl-N-methylethanolamine N-methyltransferase